MAAATLASATASNCNLSTDPKRMAVINVRNNDDDPRVVNSSDLLLPLSGKSTGSAEREFDGAKLHHKLETNSMLAGLIRQGMKIEYSEWYLNFHEQHDVKLHLGAGVGMARVAQFILGQTEYPRVRALPD
ncbi:amino acid--tRNA ligase-related protein [Hymenobacter terrenus]|uniref:amino acid--tRNA ligase-related protein n=1 Tax=Hymenobacter terrenus TaxID=1629124 RepID=UPI0018CCE429